MSQEGWNIFISEKASREKKKDKTKQKQDRKTSDKKRKKGGKLRVACRTTATH